MVISFGAMAQITESKEPAEVEVESQIPPKFKEGETLSGFILGNLKYPPAAMAAEAEGRVLVEFIVEVDGTVSNVRTVGKKKLGFGLEEEAMRVVKLTSGKWVAAKQDGNAVKAPMVMPVNFQLY